jgi:casein kinase II subunit beta
MPLAWMSGELWIDAFMASPRGRFFAKVDMAYLNDAFNLYGIRSKVRDSFRYAIELVRGHSISGEHRLSEWPAYVDRDAIEKAAVRLYGLVHARFLLTRGQRQGLDQMYEKYSRQEFPRCPRTYCEGHVCLPFGPSEEPDESVLRMFCPNCREVYTTDDLICEQIDGAYFGPSWVHLFVQEYQAKDVIKKGELKKPPIRLFGFRIETGLCDEASEED